MTTAMTTAMARDNRSRAAAAEGDGSPSRAARQCDHRAAISSHYGATNLTGPSARGSPMKPYRADHASLETTAIHKTANNQDN